MGFRPSAPKPHCLNPAPRVPPRQFTFVGNNRAGKIRAGTVRIEYGALAWEQEPRKTHSICRPFFDRRVGSSILASISEAGRNDQHSSWSKPLPPRSRTCESRLSECVHVGIAVHDDRQFRIFVPSRHFLIFVHFPKLPSRQLPKIIFSIPIRECALPPRESLPYSLRKRMVPPYSAFSHSQSVINDDPLTCISHHEFGALQLS